jgi:hypothetical protein
LTVLGTAQFVPDFDQISYLPQLFVQPGLCWMTAQARVPNHIDASKSRPRGYRTVGYR